MSDIKNLPSTSLYAYTTLISLVICLPMALAVEGSGLMAGYHAAVAQVGAQHFWTSLASVGLLYHLYNQARFLIPALPTEMQWHTVEPTLNGMNW